MKNNFKKILSGILVVMFTSTTPTAFAISEAGSIPKMPEYLEQSQKPVLRNEKTSTLKLEGDISITKSNPKINLSLRDSDVRQVLRMFADKAGLNIVFHNSASGQVTLDLVDMPLNDAFKLVLQVSDLTYYVDQNTMVIASAAASKSLNLSKQEMVAIPVNYIDAGTIASFLNKNIFSINKPGLSNAEIAVTNPNTNEILIFGTQNDARIAQKVISKFDVEPKSTTVAVNHTTPKEMANLVCQMLIPATSSSKGGSAGGGASSGGGGNSSSEISIGEGILACKIDNNVKAGSLQSLEVQNLSVSYFPQRGTLSILGGSDKQVKLIKDFIKKNDVKQPQAILEVSIIELNESGSRTFENTWQILSRYFSATLAGGVQTQPSYPTFVNGDIFDLTQNGGTGGAIIKKFMGPGAITYTINYLIENKKGRVLANPKIMVTNGQSSTIDMTSDYVKTVTSEILSGSSSLVGGTQRTYEIGDDDGIKIELVPFISPEGYVTLNITSEYSTIKEKVYTLGNAGVEDLAATLLQRRDLDLKNIRIKDGETLIIGGMIKEDETKTVKKVPLLGDIPGLGMFFRSSTSEKSKNELIIMMTPRIIKDYEDIANSGESL